MNESAAQDSLVAAVTEQALEALVPERHPRATILGSSEAPSPTVAHLVRDRLAEHGVEVTVLPVATVARALPREDGNTGGELTIDVTGGDPLPAAQYAVLSGQRLLVAPRDACPQDHMNPALFLGRELGAAGVVVEDIAVRQVSVEICGVRPVATWSLDLSHATADGSQPSEATDLLMPRGSILHLSCDRDLVRADFTSGGSTYTWWTDELTVEATEGDQVLTFDDSVHLGMTGPLLIGRLDHLPQRASRATA